MNRVQAWLTEATESVISGAAINRRTTLPFNGGKVYLRVTRRMIHNRACGLTMTVDIGSVEFPEGRQRKGGFDRLLDEVRAVTQCPIYVECVLNEQFRPALERRGFVQDGQGFPPSYSLVGPVKRVAKVQGHE